MKIVQNTEPLQTQGHFKTFYGNTELGCETLIRADPSRNNELINFCVFVCVPPLLSNKDEI